MNEKEIQEFLKRYGTPAIRREKHITSRRYNLIAFRNTESGKETLATIEYLTMKQAREIKAEYLREDNIFCDIIEDVTEDRSGKEIVFHPHQEIPIVVGKTHFNTPEATHLIIERDRRNNRKKASFRNRMNKGSSGKTIRYTGSHTDPKSPLYPMYLDNVERRGFTVIDKVTNQKFKGLQEEISQLIFELFKSGRNKNDLDISFNGV